MANDNKLSPDEFEQLAATVRANNLDMDMHDPLLLVERVYKLWWNWADFSIFIVTPTIDVISPPFIINPAPLEGTDDYEWVYPIHDFGYKMTTSKASDMFEVGMSMCRLYYTIEKMIFLLIERLKTGGISEETEVQIAFGGHELAQRKGFECVINLNFNVVVTNFEPGSWGERYLDVVKRMVDKGYGYPSQTPRDYYRHVHGSAPKMKGQM